MKLLDHLNQDELVKSQHLDGTVNPPAADQMQGARNWEPATKWWD